MSLHLTLIKTGMRWLFKRQAGQFDAHQIRRATARGATLIPRSKRGVKQVSANGVPAEWMHARGASEDRTVLYIHGGGYCSGSPRIYRRITRTISRITGARVLVIDYRLAPEHPYPAAVDDAECAYRWLLEQGVSPTHISIAGDSAGGGLTLALMIRAKQKGLPLPAALAIMSPWTDLTVSGTSVAMNDDKDPMIPPEQLKLIATWYATDTPLTHPEISPLNADLSGLPPTMIHVGSIEVLLSDSKDLATRLDEFGVDVTLQIWEGMPHVWQFLAPVLKQGNQSLQGLSVFLRDHWPKRSET